MQEPLFEGVTLIEVAEHLDEAECSGQPLICCFVKKAAVRFTSVVVALFDHSKESFERNLSGLPTSVTVHDFYNGPLSSFADYKDTLLRVGSVQKGVLIIESLTALQWVDGGGVDKICSLLHQLAKSNPVVALIHGDLLSALEAKRLAYVADSYYKLSANDGTAFASCLIRRGNGKLVSITESFSITSDFRLIAQDKTNASGSKPRVEDFIPPKSTAEQRPAINVPFDMGLKLSAKERQAKESIKLPYTAAQSQEGLVGLNASGSKKVKAGGQIIYVPDDADDLDDSDPDEDLMI